MLPLELNKLLIIVVVLSMALTPFLNEAGRRAASFIEDKSDTENVCLFHKIYNFGSYVHSNNVHACKDCKLWITNVFEIKCVT